MLNDAPVLNDAPEILQDNLDNFKSEIHLWHFRNIELCLSICTNEVAYATSHVEKGRLHTYYARYSIKLLQY